jgi:pyridoxamine 5'-phosphate oxidase
VPAARNDDHRVMSESDPIERFQEWLAAAGAHGIDQPHAMTLATSGPEGRPSARIVLLGGADREGFRFYTNRESRKGDELRANPHAALLFFWQPLGRQVRVEGAVSVLPEAESDRYFADRPYESRLSAWASDQSRPIESREALLSRLEEVRRRFAEGGVPRPQNWGGYLLAPNAIEFWQHGDHRLHQRRRHSRGPDGRWTSQLLAP